MIPPLKMARRGFAEAVGGLTEALDALPPGSNRDRLKRRVVQLVEQWKSILLDIEQAGG